MSVLNRLSATAGGVTRAALNRAGVLGKNGFMSCIVSIDYDAGLANSIEVLRRDGRLDPEVLALNFFFYYGALSEALAKSKNKPHISKLAVTSLLAVPKRRSRYVGATELQSAEFFNGAGVVFARELLDDSGNSISFQLNISPTENHTFKTRADACTFWLEELAKSGAHTVVISDASSTSDVVANVSSASASKVLTLHGNHFVAPYEYGSAIKPRSQLIIDNAKVCDSMVLLTENQRKDIERQFGCNQKISVIPNSKTAFKNDIVVKRKPNLFVVVSRLDAVKNIDRTIRAFKLAVEQNPELILEIWGRGTLESDLTDLIDELELSDNVFMKGYTRNPDTIFRRAQASISSSLSEGFGLSLLESMSVGTPVISFDSNYGPKEIIKDGENGFLVNSEEECAAQILRLARDNALFEELSKGGVESSDRYSEESVGEKWVALVNSLVESEKYESPFGERSIFENTNSSSSGSIFISDKEIAGRPLDGVRRVEIIRIDRTKLFNDAYSKLEPGVYRIHNISHDPASFRYAIKISQDGNVHKGTIPLKALTFKLLS
ncbi:MULTISPECIES: glycosyltransferase [Pseudomonas]|uniref:glycosyltransferase n=1 Tax=Pseudomonas TaxID=286 RepID=UPI001304AD93|nr:MULTISPECIES: glycosyltransferase [Pseudomonas]QXN52239.1 glycosyltransferase [Pseudomonas fluorescens]WSO26571.1 glycosyltransferase [Pseudomonas fluorescens]